MDVLLSTLSTKQQGQPSILRLLTSPQYHCELAGEGIESCCSLKNQFCQKYWDREEEDEDGVHEVF